jgi:FOG: PKD repeat
MTRMKTLKIALPVLFCILMVLPVSAALGISGINPVSGVNTGSVFITNLSGTDFTSDVSVRLTRNVGTNITAMYVTVVDSSRLTCVLDINGAQWGPWNVSVVNTTSLEEATLTDGFTVTNPVPTLTAITPSGGVNNGTVIITNLAGTNFLDNPTVNLTLAGVNITATNVVKDSSSKITCEFDITGATPGVWNVLLTNVDGQTASLASAFTIRYPAPFVTSVSPATGLNNQVVGITDLSGSNFMTGANVTLKKTGKADIPTINGAIVQPSKILCFFDLNGAAVGAWDVVVTNTDGQNGTLPASFTIYYPQAPDVTGITPATGANTGTVPVTVSGTGYETGAVLNLTKTGQPDITASNVNVSATTITCDFNLAGATAGMWDLTVTNDDGQSDTLGNAFTVTYPAPTVTAVTPASGMNSGTVSITDLAGTGFVTGATVKFTKSGETDIPATNINVVSSGMITCDVNLTSAVAGNWSIVVTNTDTQSGTLTDGFEVTNPAPTVTSIAPMTGVNNGVVAIADLAGTGFLNGATVTFTKTGQPDIGATNVVVTGPTKITCDVNLAGAQAGLWNVIVNNTDGKSGYQLSIFTVTNPPPTISGISPDSGLKGTTAPITDLSGTGFLAGATVHLLKTGETPIPATGVVVNLTKIMCFFDLTGATVGDWDVQVNNTDGGSATLPAAFTVYYPVAPAITSITPDTGVNTGSVAITDLAGTGFESGIAVNLTRSGYPDIPGTNVIRVSGSKVTCDFDLTGAEAGDWTVVAVNNDGQLGTLAGGFTVMHPAPTVNAIVPASGTNNGITSVTNLSGTGFLSGAAVKLVKTGETDINGTGVNVVTPVKLTCNVDLTGKATGLWDVIVLNPDGQSGSKSGIFTIENPAPTVTSISPTTGANNGAVLINNLNGTGFLAGATVRLTKSGQADIIATGVNVVSPTNINCTFDLTGKALGTWSVVVFNTDGKSGNLANAFTILPPPPAADFIGNPTIGTVPLTVQFTDTTLNNPSVWIWDFGDGTLAGIYEQNPVHTYNAPGTYNVSLNVFNAGGSDSITKTSYITVITRPIANFTASPTEGNAPLLVQFTDTSDGNPGKWTWKFGDGAFSLQQNPYHLYTKAGTYNVTLTVYNSAGSDTLTKTEMITVRSVPVANFAANITSGDAPLAVRFTDLSTGGPTSWAWTFGDGTSSADQNPVHVYTTQGTYSVKLTATNSAGSSTETKRGYITVQQGLKAAFTYTTSNPDNTAPLSVAFTDASEGRPLRYTWQFGDGYISTDRNPIHNYPNAGTYIVTLTVLNLGGTNATTQTIVVKSPLVAEFSGIPTQGSVPLTVQFTDNSIGTPERWFWSFGDGQFMEITNPASKNVIHTYNAAGNYTVQLSVTDAFGSSVISKSNYIRVLQFP